MTETLSAFRTRARHRRPWRRLAATSALVALVLGGALPAFGAATPEPTASYDASAELTLVPSGNGVVRGDISASVTVSNGTARESPASAVVLTLGDQALTDRAALSAWSSGAGGGGGMREVGTAQIGTVSPGDAASAVVRVAADDPALAGRAPGIYPLLAATTIDGVTLRSPSTVWIPDDAVTGATIGVVVPITAPPISRGLLTADALTELTAADGSLTAQLDAVSGTPAILAVDPAIPAAIRVLGDTAPATATAWLERLLELPNSRFALQFGDADLATQVQAGLATPLAPLSLASYLPAGGSAPTPEASVAATTAPGSAPAPDELAALLDIGAAHPNVYWPSGGSAAPEVLAALGALGSEQSPALTLVPSSSLAAGANGARLSARVDAAASALLVYDATISELLRAAADEPDPSARGAALVTATAQLALTGGGEPVLVSLERGTDRTRASIRAAIEAVAAAPGVSTRPLGDIAAGPAVPGEAVAVAADDSRVGALQALLADEAAIARFATILDDPGLLTGRERAEVLQLLGTAWRADAAAAQEAVTAHRAETTATLDSVGILASPVNLVSYQSTLGPIVRNSLPWPVRLALVAQPDDPRLVVQPRTEVTVQADSNVRAEVPVQAEIANGQVRIAMQLLSPTGEPIGASQTVGVDVHAEWETIGLVALIVLLIAFFGVGITRMVLRRRSVRRDAKETPA